jgi:hypothetical protein
VQSANVARRAVQIHGTYQAVGLVDLDVLDGVGNALEA